MTYRSSRSAQPWHGFDSGGNALSSKGLWRWTIAKCLWHAGGAVAGRKNERAARGDGSNLPPDGLALRLIESTPAGEMRDALGALTPSGDRGGT
jgi:hypothetical protein